MNPLIAGLLHPAAFPHPAPTPRLIETHISWVILAGDYAYKLKKPVELGFLDFSTLDRREHCCREEVRLNSRLAPDTYLDKLCVHSYCYAENFARYARATELAQQRGVSVPQLALAYVLSQPWNVFTLVGCANGAEFAVNAAALELQLSAAELAWLEGGEGTLQAAAA